MRRRFLAGAAMAAALTPAIAPAVSATPPVRWTAPATWSYELSGICAFPITIDVAQTGAEVDRFDADGNWIGALGTVKEQDTFTTNGHTLVGEWYQFTYNLKFDASGEVRMFTFHGVVQKVWLPDGTLFIGAGWQPFTGETFILVPERGVSGNVDAFCAALT